MAAEATDEMAELAADWMLEATLEAELAAEL